MAIKQGITRGDKAARMVGIVVGCIAAQWMTQVLFGGLFAFDGCALEAEYGTTRWLFGCPLYWGQVAAGALWWIAAIGGCLWVAGLPGVKTRKAENKQKLDAIINNPDLWECDPATGEWHYKG